jgi:hypothetical protein
MDVVFDGPPGPVAGRFVEVEDENGVSIRAGKWIDRADGYWALRIPSRAPVPEMPEAWSDLISAITLLAKGQSNDISPLHCEHDRLVVCSDPDKFTPEELNQLIDWGFHADEEDGDGFFYSFRFGSA